MASFLKGSSAGVAMLFHINKNSHLVTIMCRCDPV